MKKVLKISGIILGIILILMMTLPFLFKDKIIGIVKEEANKMLNATLDFEELDISLFRHFPKASIGLKNLRVTGIDEFSSDTLIAAKEINLAVDVMSLFSDKGYDISYIGIESPSIKAMKLKNGKTNWDIVKTNGSVAENTTIEAVDTTTSAFAIKLNKFVIDNARITYTDDSTGMAFYTDHLNLNLKGDMSDKQTTVECILKTENIYFAMDKAAYLRNATFDMNLNLNADFENNKYTFNENELRLNAISMKIDGWLAMLENGMDMDIHLTTPKIEFKDILSLIPAIYQNNFNDLQTSGNISLDASAKGKMVGDNMPAFNAKLNVNNARFNYTGMPQAVEQIIINAQVNNPGGSLNNTIIEISNFGFKFANNPFQASLYATTPLTDLNFNAQANGTINLNAIKDVYPLGDSINLNGIVTANLKFKGKMSDIEAEKYENIQGEGFVSIDKMNVHVSGMPAVGIETAKASVTPKALALEQLRLNVGKSDLQAQGELSNYIAYFLKGQTIKGNLKISSNLLDLNEFMSNATTTKTATATETQADTSAVKAFVVPKNLNLALNANVKKILFQKMILDNFTGNLTVANGIIQMNPLQVNAFNGSVSAKGSYNTAVSETNPEVAFALNIQKASFEETFKQLDIIQKLVPIFSKTGGDYSVSFDMTTTLNNNMSVDLNSLYAKGVLQSNNIHLQNVEVFDQLATLLKNDKFKKIEANDLRIPFTIKDGKVETAPFDLKLGNINVNLAGTTSLNQTINYKATIDLSKEKSIGSYISKVNATIGGTFSKPTIKLNTEDLIKDAVKQNVTDKLIEKIAGNGTTEEQIANIRKKAEDAGKKLVDVAQTEGDKLVEKASNPLTKIAAKKAAEQLVKEAQKQADKLVEEAEKQIKVLQGEAQ